MQIELMQIASAIMVFIMVKKQTKPIFGQLTLTGEMALDWLKSGDEIIAKTIWFANATSLPEWNIPEWAINKGIVCLIFPTNEWGNPLFITQKSILKVLEERCVTWEAAGAKCDILGTKLQGQISEIAFEENHPVLRFSRPEGCATYAPYIVEVNPEN